MDPNYEMFFEYTIRAFLGDKASHIAGQVHAAKSRKDWYKKVLAKIILRISEIDTSTKHKEQLTHWSERALRELKDKSYSEIAFTLCLLRLIAALLGYVGTRPYNIATPAYFQTPSQHYTRVIIEGGDTLQNYYDKKNSFSTRARLAQQLKDEGHSDFEISLVFNTSEYEIKKLRKEL